MAIETSDAVAGRVRAFSAERRISQANLATAIGMSKMSMSRRFNGAVPFTVDELGRIADYFDVGLDALILSPSTPTARPVDDLPPVSAGRASSSSKDAA